MRTKLKTGQQISLVCDGANKIFTINRIIGDGATCIAYEASSVNSWGVTEQYRIKECYPYNTDIIRNELCLNWTNEDDKTAYFTRFKNSYILMNQLKAEENIGNNITSTMLCEGNGTLYSVMDVNHATVYSKDTSKNLKKILETMLVLTKVTGNLHSKGYLHLDIKPENFLVTYEPSTNIWLFDVDSLTSIEELKNGIVKTTPYSFTYAAPEQKFGETSKISPATDIYAIGAVMFEKIMGRSVSVDDIGVFAKWDLDANPIFEGINPKAKRLIKSIFKKTLAISPKRRYQNTDELAYALENVIKAVNENLFISSNIPANAAHFIGRETELSAIHNEFSIGQKAVFIHGFGGMGKSSLAVAYANKYKDSYDTAVFLKYRDSLKELLCEINIQNYEGSDTDKLKVIPKLLDKNCLLIIDNFDIEIDQDEYLDELLQLNTNILFTTRTDFSSVYGEDTTQIEVSQLADKELLQLFRTISGDNHSTDEMISKLLLLVEGHTYAVELLALQIAASGCTIGELHNKVSNGLDELSDSEKVRTRKDGHIVKRTIPEIIRTLFNVAELDDNKKQVLRNLYLLSSIHLDKDTYRKFTNASVQEINALNDLAESGWVQTSYSYWYFLHPLVEEIVNNDLIPDNNNCHEIFNIITQKIAKWKYCGIPDEIDEYEYSNDLTLFISFFNSLNLKNYANRNLLITWLLDTINHDDFSIGTYDHSAFSPLYRHLETMVSLNDITTEEIFNIHYIILNSWLEEFDIIYTGDESVVSNKVHIRETNLINRYGSIVALCEKLELTQKDIYLDEASEAIVNKAANMLFPTLPYSLLLDIYKVRPYLFGSDSAYLKNKLNLPLTTDEKAEIDRIFGNLPDVFKPGYTDDDIEFEKKFHSDFMNSNDKVDFVKQIIDYDNYSAIEKAGLIEDCIDLILGRYRNYEYYNNFTERDWDCIEQILDIEVDYLCSDAFDDISVKDFNLWNTYTGRNVVNQLLVYSATNQIDFFKKAMETLLSDMEIEAKNMLEEDYHWSKLIDMSYPYVLIGNALGALKRVDKVSYILSYLIEVNNKYLNYAKSKSDFDEKYFFSNYKMISEAAAWADMERNVPNEFKTHFLDIEMEYQEKMDMLTGKDFSFKI